MKIEKISYFNSTTNNLKTKKSFYKNEESEDAITFSSELNKENSENQKFTNENEQNELKEDNKNTNLAQSKNVNILTNENSKKSSEKLNIII